MYSLEFNNVLQFQEFLIKISTSMNDYKIDEYENQRSYLLDLRQKNLEILLADDLIPKFIVECRSCTQFLSYIRSYAKNEGSYKLRSNHIYDEFSRLLEFLEFGRINPKINKADNIEDNFWQVINPKVRDKCKKLFDENNFSQSIELGCKIINNQIKEIHKQSTSQDKDGKGLMMAALSQNGSIKFNNNSSESEKDEQEGFMHIYAGLMQGIRNPKIHDEIIITKERCIHFLFLISLLQYKLDERIGN